MTSREFIQNQFGNADGKEKWCSSILKDGDGNIFSYGPHYPLLFQVAGLTFRNVKGYSNTTSKHIGWCYGFNAIDIELPRDFRLLSWDSEEQKLARIIQALEAQAKELSELKQSKKRKNTYVYSRLDQDHNKVLTNLALLKHHQTGEIPEVTPAENGGLAHLRTVSGVMALGDIFGHNQKESNDWKARMLRAGLEGRGLIMPEDWDQLDENTKEARLNGAIELLG